VNSELAAAAKTVKGANELKAKAAFLSEAAATRLREAEAAKKKADASGKPNDKKLADEKAKLTAAANAKVADANKKATDAANKAKAVAAKALNLKKALDKAKAKTKRQRLIAKMKANAARKKNAAAASLGGRSVEAMQGRAAKAAARRAQQKKRAGQKKGNKLKRCKGKWSKWTGCGTDCIATKTWTTTGTKKGCRSPTIKTAKCTAKHSYRCAPGYVPKDMKRGKPGEAQAESLAKRKAGAEKRAASQARIDALVANFDPEADKKRAAAPRSQIRCRDSDGNPYFAWSCKAGDSKM
jgi:hypothetical protein